MAFNKAKTLATAKQYIEKGKLREAIVQYERLCADAPTDIKSRVSLAGLQHEHGDLASALCTYDDIATQFTAGGLLLKSVAVYKQMLRLDYGLHSVHVALAHTYHELGLANDSVSQYQRAIRMLTQRDQTIEKLYVIRELLDLDPDNVRGRVRLAEDFFAENRTDDGVRELRLALETLSRDGTGEQFILVAERLLHHQPEDALVARRLAELLLSEDNPQAALPRLQACFRAHPQDVEVLDMLACCFNQLGQSHKALTVLKELARIHDRNGLVEERNEALRQVLLVNPSDQSARAVLDKRPGEVGDTEAAEFGTITFDDLEDEDALEVESPDEARGEEDSEFEVEVPQDADPLGDIAALIEEAVTIEPVESHTTEHDKLDAAEAHSGHPPNSENVPPPAPDEALDDPVSTDIEKLTNSVAPPTPEEADQVSAGPPPFDEMDHTIEDVVDLDTLDLSEVDLVVDGDDETGLEPEPTHDQAPEVQPEQQPSPLPSAVMDELQEFEFYLKNRLFDAARSVLDDLDASYASHPDVMSRRARLPS